MNGLWVVVILGYAVCLVQAVSALTARRSSLRKLAAVALAIAFAAHTVWLLNKGLSTGRCPVAGTQETSAFLSWSLVVFHLIAQRLARTEALKVFIFPIVLVLAVVAAIAPGTYDNPEGINQPLQRFLFPVHAGLIMLAYAAFFIAFGAGLMYIIQERELKLKRFSTIFFRLPSLDTCDAISLKSLVIGFILLTLGIAAGVAWSRARDGVFWHGQPIEVFSYFTWVIYLLILQSRVSASWGGRKAALASIIGFVLAVFSLAGVRYLGTLHVFS
jgi:ABC-type transport system involved in cytochrome c biogenesis permease subunit